MKFLKQFLSLGFLAFPTVQIHAQHEHMAAAIHPGVKSSVVSVSPMIAALAMGFSSVSVIANALRLRTIKI